MGTRKTLSYDPEGRSFHLYQDYADGPQEHDQVYLRIKCCEACGHEQTITIPAEVWECIRQVPSNDFAMVDLTDEEIQAKVEAEVNERIKNFEEAKTDRAQALAGAAAPPHP